MASVSETGADVLRKQGTYLFPAVITYYNEPLPIQKAEGHHMWDFEGNKYLDFFGGVLTVSVGHCRPEVTEAIRKQSETLQHVSTLYPTAPQADFAEKLAEITPGKLSKSFFTNSGSEADEMAVTAAKVKTDSNTVIASRHAYFGRSTLAITMTAQAPWRVLDDQVAGVKHAMSPYCYRCPLKLTYPECGVACAEDLEELIRTTTSGKIAGMIAEPIQGVGGFVTPPKEYFKIAAEIVHKYGGLMIIDEVQTGFGRTGGKMWGIEHWDIEPDIMTMAKGVANGVPMGVTITTPEVADAWVGLTFSTFGGNPVSCAASSATVDIIEKENLVDNAQVMGGKLRAGLEAMKDKYRSVGDVRGMGLMQGVEFVKDKGTKEPSPDIVDALFEETRTRGLIIGKGGLYGNVIRVSPSLDVTADEVDEALEIIDEALATIEK